MYGWTRNLGLVAALALAGAAQAAERFVGSSRGVAGVLELRTEATVFGPEVRLKQVCRWEEGQEGQLAEWGDLVVTRITGEERKANVSLLGVKAMLRDAGMGLASVRFAGPLECVVTRADGGVADIPGSQSPAPSVAPATQPAAEEKVAGVVTLKEKLTRDLAERLRLPVDMLQVSFSPQDEKLLVLSEPQFRFEIEPRRVRNLGAVSWDVAVVTDATAAAGGVQRAVIAATARAWQNQLVTDRPISGRQIIRAEDVVEKRALVESLPDVPLARREQIVGQQAALDLKPGAVMTANMVQAVPLARPGQIVTVTVNAGGVQVRTVAKAVDEGTYGQTIRVRNEQTKEQFDVTLTGPQQAVMGSIGGMSGRNG